MSLYCLNPCLPAVRGTAPATFMYIDIIFYFMVTYWYFVLPRVNVSQRIIPESSILLGMIANYFTEDDTSSKSFTEDDTSSKCFTEDGASCKHFTEDDISCKLFIEDDTINAM